MDQSTNSNEPLSLLEYSEIINEIRAQPRWRHIADKEMDYADGNQLDSDLLRKQKEVGIPPAIEDLIGPALLSIRGYEEKTRTDWRVTANGEPGSQDIADAINFKLNQAERESKADSAMSGAFKPEIGCGLGWVEVAKDSDPFNFPHRCKTIHRNEIHWDMKSTEADLTDARWLRRQRWLAPSRIALVFPDKKDIIDACGTYGPSWWGDIDISEGGVSTGLQNAWNDGRAWTHQEERWYNPLNKELCVSELWYRRWQRVPVIRAPDGRVVEYDENNMAHNVAIAMSVARIQHATVARVRRSYWLGPHLMNDSPTPYAHRYFPYVPFWGFREDSTSIPFGYVRGMKYSQDAVNSGTSKLRHGMSVVRLERTKGATDMSDAQVRRQVARSDGDIILNAEHMSKPGARFAVERDYELTDQHFQLLNDSRAAIERVSTVTAGFTGRQGTATSGLQEQTQVEQSNQALGVIMGNFRAGRTLVGELLMANIIQDMGTDRHEIIIEGDAVRADRTVIINAPETDPLTGTTYLSNDLQRTRLKVVLEDVPSTNSYRGQQLNALSEAVKSMPEQYKAAVLPFLVSLMDVPFKRDVVEAIRGAAAQETPDQVEERIKKAVQEALVSAGNDLKTRELDMKERKTDAEILGIISKSVETTVTSMFSSMQAAGQIATMPQIAPIADAIMEAGGYKRPNPLGDDPNFLVPAAPVAVDRSQLPPVHQNTSPQFPPVPSHGASPMNGIETTTTADNLSGAPS